MDKDSKLTVGLYTWCYDNGRTNYGQILQCYATQTLFEEMGLKVQLIRYRKLEENESPPALQCDRVEYEKQYRINVVEGYIDDRVRSILAFISNNINCGPICYTEDELRKSVEGCDVLVCGSDQLWNPKYYHSSICLFSWDRTDRKRISFATSGANDDSDDDKKKCREIGALLSDFSYVSVREKRAKEVLKKYCKNREIVEVLDPVFLLNRQHWDSVIATNQAISQKHNNYILCYFLGGVRDKKIVIKQLLKKHNASVAICIKTNYYYRNEGIGDENLFIEEKGVGIAEFLSLISHANAVYTDSFHGCAFSIIFKKEFYIASFDNLFRIQDICEKLGITNRYAYSLRYLEKVDSIDYTNVEKRLNYWIKQSRLFLDCLLRK